MKDNSSKKTTLAARILAGILALLLLGGSVFTLIMYINA